MSQHSSCQLIGGKIHRSGITNDPSRDDDPTCIIRLINKVVSVSVETVGLVEGMI